MTVEQKGLISVLCSIFQRRAKTRVETKTRTRTNGTTEAGFGTSFHFVVGLCANGNVTCTCQEPCGTFQYAIKQETFLRILKSLYICSDISSVGLISTVLLTMKVKGDSNWTRAVLKTCKYTQQSTLNLGQFHTHFLKHTILKKKNKKHYVPV